MKFKIEIKKHIKLIINISVLIISIVILLRTINFSVVFNELATISPYIYILTLSLAIYRNWLCSLRWAALHPVSNERLSKWIYFKLTMLSHLFNLIMPGALGGDVIKTIYAVGEREKNRMNDVIAVFVDRTIGLLSIMFFGLVSMLFIHKKLNINWFQLLLLFFLSGGFIVFIVNKKVLNFLEKILSSIPIVKKATKTIFSSWRNALVFYKMNPKKVLYSLALCIPINIISFLTYFIFSLYLGLSINFLNIIFSISIMWLITALPISLGGVGVRELSLIWLLGMFGVSSEQAVTLSLLVYINTIIIAIIALPFLLDVRHKKQIANLSIDNKIADSNVDNTI